jgi:hypothetical protein
MKGCAEQIYERYEYWTRIASGSKGKSMNEYYQYLDALRESGVTNMYGAGAYLQDRFDLSKVEARDILTAWMKQFTK